MSESITITAIDKSEKYNELIQQIKAVVDSENDLVANLANISAMLKEVFDFFWVGFYIVKDDELVLGPFQGTLACTRIKKGRGVCGTAWSKAQSIVVDDVEKFDGHIACSSLSKSEIVVPILVDGTVVAVIDVDSQNIATFNEIDKINLEIIAQIVSNIFVKCVK